MDPSTDKNDLTSWCEESTRFLLDRYQQYLPMIGPMKRFKSKKCMWVQISSDISTELNIVRSSVECENHYKTILKRKAQSVRSNQQSGAKRTKVEFEEEFNKIKAIDDSLEPEVLQGPGQIIEKNKKEDKENVPMARTVQKKATQKVSISETLLHIQKDKEEKREKRHTEKLELLRNFMKIFLTRNDTTDSNSD